MEQQMIPMGTCFCEEVIISAIERRGKGELLSPIRVVTQVFRKDGKLIAESDPVNELFALGDLVNFANHCIKQNLVGASYKEAKEWAEQFVKNPNSLNK